MVHTFSREESKEMALQIKIRRAKTMARAQKADYKTKHPQECVAANTGNYTLLVKRVTEECKKAQLKTEKYRSKLHAKVD